MYKASLLLPVLMCGCGRLVAHDDGADARPLDARPADARALVDASADARLLPDGRVPDPPADAGPNCLLWDFTLEAPARTSTLYFDQARLDGGPPEYLVAHPGGVGVDDEVVDSDEHVTLNAVYPDPAGTGVEGTFHAWRLVPVTPARIDYYVDGDAELTTIRVEPDDTGWLRLGVEVSWSTIYPDSPTVVAAVEFCRPEPPPVTPALDRTDWP